MNFPQHITTRFLSKKHLLEAIDKIFTDEKMIRAKDIELVFEKFGDYYDLATQTVSSGYNGWSDSGGEEIDDCKQNDIYTDSL